MKKLLVTTLLAAAVTGGQAQVKHQSHGYPIDPVPFTSVKVTDSFWGQRLKASREVTIPLAFSKCEETGRYRNFINAAHPSDTIKVGGLAFDDTDVYKTIEGASYLLQTYPDKKLAKYIDSVLVIVAAAQEPDGYLYTSRTMNPKHPHEWAGSKRWEKVEELSHEFYNLGHMVEGAIAHYQATGKRNFLDIAIRYADCVCREIGSGPGQQVRVPGHQIAEMALAKLYLVTGQQKYLDQAKFFLDQRGHTSRTDEYSQAHKPVTEQDEAVGHAVRAAYMYAGMDEKGNAMWYMDETNEKGEVTGRTTTTTYADATRYFIGKSALPDFNGGLSTTFSYKGIDLSIATAFQIGGYAYDYSYLSGMSSSFYVGHNKDMWKTFNPETGQGSLPIWNADNASNSFTQQSDLNLVKASYFSIRNITLGYTLPKNLMQKLGVEKLRIYATADNLGLWSKRQGFDPRVAMAGSDNEYGGYSPMRVISGGINLTF